MKKTILASLLIASTFGVAATAQAQVAGAQVIGVTVEQATLIVNGWSVKKAFLGKQVLNDQGERVGAIHDLILSPDGTASFAIIAAHQFAGFSQHDVAVPVSQLDFKDGKLIWAGATHAALKAMPTFQYTKVKQVPVSRQEVIHP